MSEIKPKALVFTASSLYKFILNADTSAWLLGLPNTDKHVSGLACKVKAGNVYLLDTSAKSPEVRVVIDLGDSCGFPGNLNPSGIPQALRRVHRIAIQAAKRKLAFPHNWSQFVADNLVAVFAYPMFFGSERLIASVDTGQPADVFICQVTKEDSLVNLWGYEVGREVFDKALELYEEAASEAVADLVYGERSEQIGVIDLEAVGFGSLVGGKSYSSWMNQLSEAQERFVLDSSGVSIKLRGAAGTGKTLALELKALHEVYRAREEGREVRLLFVTHSWSVAEQVWEALRRLDEQDALGTIDVVPLLTLAEFRTEIGGSVTLLGEDSYSGKERQLRKLAGLVRSARTGAWLTFKNACSDAFVERVEAEEGGPEANLFLWDLMLEFSCVIGAKGIFPGFNGVEKYKELERRPWMMPLATAAEKEFCFYIYEQLVGDLLESGEITTDQLINDYLNFLCTYRWYAERRDDGYDFIFVDEFHLFNEQERMVFHYLSRDPSKHPVVYMAMDPRQSPFETYVDFVAPAEALRSSGSAERSLGGYSNIDLTSAFRYTPEIHAFLRHLDQRYPALELGKDWEVSVSDASTTRESGVKPKLYLHNSADVEAEEVLRDGESLVLSGRTVAVLCLDNSSLRSCIEATKRGVGGRVTIIGSRDDTETLRYTKRSLVLSQPHFVAGLQFDAVVIGGCRSEFSPHEAHQAYILRRFLSDLYLGASRARDVLHLHGSSKGKEYPAVLEDAVEAGVVVFQEERGL